MHLRAIDFSKGVSCQLDPKCCGLTDLEHGCFLGIRSAFCRGGNDTFLSIQKTLP